MWFPEARRSAVFPGSGAMAGPRRGVIHSTEGSTVAGALATYRRTRSYPHFTVGDTIEQHCSTNVSATALRNTPGGVETNRRGAIQIEVVGFAARIHELPPKTKDNLMHLMRWMQDTLGIRPHYVPFVSYPKSYGFRNGIRFNAADWWMFDGWCGHQHVPENSHGDPGAFDISWYLDQIAPKQNVITRGDSLKMNITPTVVEVARLDKDGNGWVPLDIPFDKVVSLVKWGPAPARDGGYDNAGWPDFALKINNTDGKALISIESDVPFGAVKFTVWSND